MAHNTALKKNSVLFWLVALSGSAIFSIGLRFLFTPLVAAEDFGVPVSDFQNVAYLRAVGTRDIVFGLLGFALLALVSRRVLAVFVGVVALIPLGDFTFDFVIAREGRTQTKRLQRSTIGFSKTKEMPDAMLKLYIHRRRSNPGSGSRRE